MKLVTVGQMRAIEAEANLQGVTYEIMMGKAGCGLAEIVHAVAQEEGWDEVTGIVGPGNNGGDTLVALAWLAEAGWRTHAYLVKRSAAEDPLVARFTEAGGEVLEYVIDKELSGLRSALEASDVLFDGLLGTGFKLPLKPELAAFLRGVAGLLSELEFPPVVIAVDCPSGVDCDTGETASEVIAADWTITMAAVKQGLLKLPAYKRIGDLQVVDIGLPVGLSSVENVCVDVADHEMVSALLPCREPDSHKGTFGTALIAAGSVNYTGAALLAGEAAYRIGTGLVTMAVIEPLYSALAGQMPEATWVILPNESGFISGTAADTLLKHIDRATALLMGPGVGNLISTRKFIESIVVSAKIPLVVDADGLRHLVQIPDWHKRLLQPAVLTPHPGEMSLMTGLSREQIQSDRQGTALKYAQEWGHVVVLKGAFTVVASPDGRATVIPVATPALARAGSGDVLAGMIVGLRAQGLEPYPAAISGAFIHAQAGLLAAEVQGETASVLAGDLLDVIGQVIAELR